MGFDIKIDDRQVQRFMKISPARASWANIEALKMTGGHLRGKIRGFIESGGRGWQPLSPARRADAAGHQLENKKKKGKSPLYFMGRLIRWKYSRSKGIPKVTIGLFPSVKRRKRDRMATGLTYKISTTKKLREDFKAGFGMTYAAFANMMEYGKRIRVTPQMRRMFQAAGAPLLSTTKTLTIPARPAVGPVYRKEKSHIPIYFERRFFQKFFSKENPRVSI